MYKTHHEHYIDIREKNERIEFVKLLEEKGYLIGEFSKEDIISSVFPITVDVKKKTIGHMGNATVSACATTAGVLEDKQSFLNRLLKCQQLVNVYNEWLSKGSQKETHGFEDTNEWIKKFNELEIADYDNYMENHKLIENKNIKNLSIDEILTELTFCIRGEYWSNGFMEYCIENGTIDKLIKCLDERTK